MKNKRTRRQADRAMPGPRAELIEPRLLFSAYVTGSGTVYATIQAAVNAAPVGGTVTVDAGTYAEQVTVSKTLTIDGAEAGVDASAGARITATTSTETYVTGATSGGVVSSAFHILADDVTIDGFTVTGETNSDDELGAGIVIGPQLSGTHILDNVIRNNVSGLFLANYSSTDAAVIEHNYFGYNNNAGDNGGRGIYTDGTISGGILTNVTIDDNNFSNNRGSSGTTGLEAAIALEASHAGEQSNFRITGNTFTSNGKAVLFFNTTDVIFEENTVTYSLDQFSGSVRFEGNDNTVSILYNNIYNNTGPGVAVDSKGVPGDNYGFVVNYNNFYNNNTSYTDPYAIAVNFSSYDGAFDARYNWYGDPSGPSGEGPGTGDAISNGVFGDGVPSGWSMTAGGDFLYSPWATSPVSFPASAPTAPSGLTAAGVSATQINLSWTDTAAGNETGFEVQRSTDGSAFAQIGTTASGVTHYTDTTGLAASTTYSYRVLAMNAAGTSASSNVATGTTLASTGTTYLSDLNWTSATTGYGTIHKDATVNGNAITLRGVSYAKGIGTHAVSSIVYALNGGYATFATDVGVDDEVNGNGSVDFQVLGDGKVLFDSGVLTGTSAVVHLNVSVAGVATLTLNVTNGISGSIDYDHADWAGALLTVATSTPMVPTAPTSLTATSASSTVINLSWTAATGQTAYAVDRSTDGGNTYTTIATPSGTTYSDTGLTASTTYTYRVRATNTAGTSAASNVVSATTAGVVPTAPSGLIATAAASSVINLSWTAATGQTAYAVDRSTDGGKTYTTIATPTIAAYSDTGLTASTTYTYRVRATNTSGTSTASNVVSAMTAAITPAVTALTGTVIGTAGSYKNDGNTIAKAFDGNLNTFYDGAAATGDWAGLDLGSAKSIVQIAFAPRSGYASRMVGGTFQSSPSATFASGIVNLYTISTTPVQGKLTTVSITSSTAQRYVRYLSPANSSGNVAEIVFYGSSSTTAVISARTGAVIGTPGSYKSSGNTIANAVDGNLSTFFDGPMANGCWVGLDLGSAESVSQISYAPRSGYASRMVGGVFQSSTTADFGSDVTTLFTITAVPASGVLTTVKLASPVTARYFRYLSPNGSEGDVAEIAFAG